MFVLSLTQTGLVHCIGNQHNSAFPLCSIASTALGIAAPQRTCMRSGDFFGLQCKKAGTPLADSNHVLIPLREAGTEQHNRWASALIYGLAQRCLSEHPPAPRAVHRSSRTGRTPEGAATCARREWRWSGECGAAWPGVLGREAAAVGGRSWRGWGAGRAEGPAGICVGSRRGWGRLRGRGPGGAEGQRGSGRGCRGWPLRRALLKGAQQARSAPEAAGDWPGHRGGLCACVYTNIYFC